VNSVGYYSHNREFRRNAIKQARGNPDALYCPRCQHKTLHVGYPKNPVNTGKGMIYKVVCEICGNEYGEAPNGKKGIHDRDHVKGRYWK